MEYIQSTFDLFSSIVVAFGIGMAAIGAIMFFLAFGDQNPAEKKTGMGLLMGGAGIIIIGLFMIPAIPNALPTGF